MTQPINAVLIIDKPPGLTSHDVVARVRHIFQQRAVGHLGTLDPLATGVLPLVLGNMTRLAQFYLKSEKSYEGVIRFGLATDSYDADGEPVGEVTDPTLAFEHVRELAGKFRGVIKQTPPPFSAKKVQGVPAYKLARKNKPASLQPIQVEVKEFEILKLDGARAHFRSRVSSGTYVRSIAHELGQMANCGAHLETLRRTSVAEFTLADAHRLEDLAGLGRHHDAGTPLLADVARRGDEPGTDDLFIHPRKLLPALPSVTATDEIAVRIRHGQSVNLPDTSRARELKVFQGQRDLIAIATRIAGTLFHPKLVLS